LLAPNPLTAPGWGKDDALVSLINRLSVIAVVAMIALLLLAMTYLLAVGSPT
jgi:hypothetical protein